MKNKNLSIDGEGSFDFEESHNLKWKRGIAIFFVLFLLAGGIFAIFYFTQSYEKNPEKVYNNIELKSAYAPDGNLKLFAYARNNDLRTLDVVEGNSIPESDSVVIGFEEAEIMKKEGLFNKTGDSINDLFGVDVRIDGILKRTGSIIDNLHFLTRDTFEKLEGENRIFIKFTENNMPKLFYTYNYGDNARLKLELKEGNLADYTDIHDIAGKKYYPIILGSKEAEIMRKENLFNNTGDIIKGFFGNNVVVVGIAKETNSSFDFVHVVPLSKEDLI